MTTVNVTATNNTVTVTENNSSTVVQNQSSNTVTVTASGSSTVVQNTEAATVNVTESSTSTVVQTPVTTTVTATTAGPQGPRGETGSGFTLDATAKVDKSVIYYDSSSGEFKADTTWTVETIVLGGNF